jgi:putative aldouronate transport system permease protein
MTNRLLNQSSSFLETDAVLRLRKKSPLRLELTRNRALYLMVIPSVVLIFLFAYLPMFGVLVAFKNYNLALGVIRSPWVGFKYFIQFFNDPFFYRIVNNTFLLSLFSIMIGFPAPIVFSLLMNEIQSTKLKRVLQSISYLPHFVSTVVIVSIVMIVFSPDGIVNDLIGAIGLENQVFFSDPKWFRPLYIGSGIWQSVGFSSIIYLAAIAGINPELYESACIEGAGKLKSMWYITLPCIMPTIRILFILEMGSLFNIGFEKVYLMYNPAIYQTADVVSTYVYRRGIGQLDYDYATAVGLINSTISFILVFITNKISNKISGEGLW